MYIVFLLDSMYNSPSHGIQPDQSSYRTTNKSDPSLKVKQKDPELSVKEVSFNRSKLVMCFC